MMVVMRMVVMTVADVSALAVRRGATVIAAGAGVGSVAAAATVAHAADDGVGVEVGVDMDLVAVLVVVCRVNGAVQVIGVRRQLAHVDRMVVHVSQGN